jgi:hypothetical protein
MIDRSGKPIRLEIDGGVKADNIGENRRGRRRHLRRGSAIFKRPITPKVMRRMKRQSRARAAASGCRGPDKQSGKPLPACRGRLEAIQPPPVVLRMDS